MLDFLIERTSIHTMAGKESHVFSKIILEISYTLVCLLKLSLKEHPKTTLQKPHLCHQTYKNLS